MVRNVPNHDRPAGRRGTPVTAVFLRALAVAWVLVGLGSVPASATLFNDQVKCGLTACSDTWIATCPSANFMTARVRDSVGSDDTLMVMLVADAPSSIRGQAETEVADFPGQVSPLSVLLLPSGKESSITAYAVVTNLFDTKDSVYEIEFTCGKSNGSAVEPRNVKLLRKN